MPKLPESLARRAAELTGVVAAAVAGGGALASLGVPAGWLSGAMLGVGALAAAGRATPLPTAVRQLAILSTGVGMGSGLTPSTLHTLARYPISLLLMAVAIAAMTAASYLVLVRAPGFSRRTALYSAIPGALSYVFIVAEPSGADMPRLAVIQVFRIFIHPVVGLPLDRLSSVSTADVRLLRRIVRDRHGRNVSAADNILRWPAVRDGERRHIFPFLPQADVVFDSSLAYEVSVLKVYADRYLLEVPREHEGFTTAYRLRRLIDRFITIYPDHVPPTSIVREFIGGSGFEY